MAFEIITTTNMLYKNTSYPLKLIHPTFFFSKHHFIPSQQKVVKNSVYIKLIYKF